MTNMRDLQDKYADLLAIAKRLSVIGSAGAILHWDLETKMPPKGIRQRSEQLALLEVIAHQTLVDPRVGMLLDALTKEHALASMDDVQKRNVHLMKKAYDEEVALPEELVEAIAKQSAITVDRWKKAKAAKDYSLYRPELDSMIQLRKESAAILRDVKGSRTEYDALLDIYEPGMTEGRISDVFTEMRDGLMRIMHSVASSDARPDLSIMKRRVPVEMQLGISKEAMSFIGYQTEGRKPPVGWMRRSIRSPSAITTTSASPPITMRTASCPACSAFSTREVMHSMNRPYPESGYTSQWATRAAMASMSLRAGSWRTSSGVARNSYHTYFLASGR